MPGGLWLMPMPGSETLVSPGHFPGQTGFLSSSTKNRKKNLFMCHTFPIFSFNFLYLGIGYPAICKCLCAFAIVYI